MLSQNVEWNVTKTQTEPKMGCLQKESQDIIGASLKPNETRGSNS